MKKQVAICMSVAILVITAISASLYQEHQSFNAKAEQSSTQTCTPNQACKSEIQQSSGNNGTNNSNMNIKTP